MRRTAISIATILVFALSLSACSQNDSDTNKQAANQTDSTAEQVTSTVSSAVKTASTNLSDTAITASVKAKLLGKLDAASTNISVTTNHGVVTLSGSVETDAQKEAAEKTTSNTSGVIDVTNNLEVVPS